MVKKSTGINIKPNSLIYPYFVVTGENIRRKIKSFPGVYRLSIDKLLKDIGQIASLGLNKILLFGIPDRKDPPGSGAYSKDNIVSSAVRKIKEIFPNLVVMTDVCLCAYTTHGHCGILKNRRSSFVVRRSSKNKNKIIDSKATLKALSKMALSHAEAGTDYIAPSAMAKKQVSAIRKALDKNGFRKTKILGYSAKFASNFYGPFRNAAHSKPKFGDRSGYQLPSGDRRLALKEIENDIKEGADIVMVKPALSYLDIIREAKTKFRKPLAAYNTSGEYAFVKYGARSGLWDERKMVFEIMTSIKRAGADFIITYHAKDIARWLREK